MNINGISSRLLSVMLRAIPWLLVFSGLLLVDYGPCNDSWFLLNHGRYVFEQGIPYIEPFTLHEGFDFVMQQWLSAVIFWQAWCAAGIDGLYAACLIMGAVMIWLSYRLIRLVGGEKKLSMSMAGIMGFLCAVFFVPRPWIFSTALLMADVYVIESYMRDGRKRWLISMPIISVLLINMHAAMWPMMFVLLLPPIAERLLGVHVDSFFSSASASPLKPVAVAAVMSFFAGFINPYGLPMMTYLLHSYGFSEINHIVAEMRPVNVQLIAGKVYFILLIMMVVGYAKHCMPARYVFLTLGMAYMAASGMRSMMLFILLGIFPIGAVLSKRVPHAVRVKEFRPARAYGALMILVACVGVIVLSQWEDFIGALCSTGAIFRTFAVLLLAAGMMNVLLAFRRYRVVSKNVYHAIAIMALISMSIMGAASYMTRYAEPAMPGCRDAVDYLLTKEQPENIRLWTGYDDGSYVEFCGIKTYLDPRAEVFLKTNNHKEDIMYEYIALERGSLDYRKFLSWYDFNYLLVSKGALLYTYLDADTAYEKIYDEGGYRIYRKR